MNETALTPKQEKMLLLLRELISDAKRTYGIGRMNAEDHRAVHLLLEVMHHLPGLAMSPDVGTQDHYWLEKKVGPFLKDFPMEQPQDRAFYSGLFDEVTSIINNG